MCILEVEHHRICCELCNIQSPGKPTNLQQCTFGMSWSYPPFSLYQGHPKHRDSTSPSHSSLQKHRAENMCYGKFAFGHQIHIAGLSMFWPGLETANEAWTWAAASLETAYCLKSVANPESKFDAAGEKVRSECDSHSSAKHAGISHLTRTDRSLNSRKLDWLQISGTEALEASDIH